MIWSKKTMELKINLYLFHLEKSKWAKKIIIIYLFIYFMIQKLLLSTNRYIVKKDSKSKI